MKKIPISAIPFSKQETRLYLNRLFPNTDGSHLWSFVFSHFLCSN